MATLHPDGFYYSYSEYLGQDQMDINARWICQYLLGAGWTKNAIAALCGNMQSESTINPGMWENRTDYELLGEDPMDNEHGFGLVQWTPWGKYMSWADDNGLRREHMESQLKRILYEVENGLQWIPTTYHPMKFKEFITSTASPYELAGHFVVCYERPTITPDTYVERGTQAEYYFELFADITGPGSKGLRAIDIILYSRRRGHVVR